MTDPTSVLESLPWSALDLLRFQMGSDDRLGQEGDDEGPARQVTVGPFIVSTTPVTTDAFAAFVEATGYETVAERAGTGFVLTPTGERQLRSGVTWRDGPASHANGGQPNGNGNDHPGGPVVQVSWIDAWEFCAWSTTRLLTEAEWERAARHAIPEMVGGPLEWCDDYYHPTHHRDEQRVNPTGPTSGTMRVARGHSPTARSAFLPDLSSTDLTFRVVRLR